MKNYNKNNNNNINNNNNNNKKPPCAWFSWDEYVHFGSVLCCILWLTWALIQDDHYTWIKQNYDYWSGFLLAWLSGLWTKKQTCSSVNFVTLYSWSWSTMVVKRHMQVKGKKRHSSNPLGRFSLSLLLVFLSCFLCFCVCQLLSTLPQFFSFFISLSLVFDVFLPTSYSLCALLIFALKGIAPARVHLYLLDLSRPRWLVKHQDTALMPAIALPPHKQLQWDPGTSAQGHQCP